MALSIEWRRRVENWRRELPHHVYRPLGTVPLEGFTTMDQLRVEEARAHRFAAMPTGMAWGAKWEYAWFRTQVVLPEAAASQRIVFRPKTGGIESAVYVGGVAAGAVDREHTEITLARKGVPGARYELMIESYAGHGPRVHSPGPVPPGRETVPEPPETQAVVGESTFGVWQEDVYQLWLDVEALIGLRDSMDPESLRVAEIDQGLRDLTVIVDFELPREEMLETVRACRERLRPLLECVNGSTAPRMYAFGHSHIDVAWLWPLAETERKCVRTFGSQLAMCDEYPDYRFLQSQPHLYWMVKTKYPDLYARVKDAVQRGQFIAEGGMWVEADTNVSGGESLIRQFIHGKRFYRDEFGVECQMLWLPDVFGYSGNMPQIMRGCGIEYFATAKIFWNYNGGDPFPFNNFVWEGIDGSEVLAHLVNDYNSRTDVATVILRWNQRVQKDGISARLLPFGWGDGGGGPTRDHMEYVRRLRDLEGAPKVHIAHPVDYFRDQQAKGAFSNRYVGELYLQVHRGTYTSQARTKRGNRKSELALREAEMWAAAAGALAGYRVPLETLDTAWKKVLLNQFHDIIPGSSIHRVYEEAEASYAEVVETAQGVAAAATKALTDGSRALTVFNSLAWPRTALVPLPQGSVGAVSSSSKPLPTQQMADATYVEVAVPSCGWTTVSLQGAPASAPASELSATPRSLENEHLRLAFNDRGEITSLYDKDAGRELAVGPCNSLKMYKDVPTSWDAWDVDSMYALTPVALDSPAAIEVLAEGPLVAQLRVTRTLNGSPMTQVISLRRGSRRVDFATELDWRESHKLLKVAFPVDVHANEAVHEIQFGHIRRPNHKSRPFDADRFEVANQKWTALMEEARGCAVLNDCKYGINVLGNSINLTLLKSPLAPDMTADKGKQVFAYAFYAWNGSFAECDLVREAYDLNCPVMTAAGAAGERSLFSVDSANVVIETVKPAEDGSGDIVVRLYESKRTATRCALTCSLPVAEAWRTNMPETKEQALSVTGGVIPLGLRPFEIATLRLRVG